MQVASARPRTNQFSITAAALASVSSQCFCLIVMSCRLSLCSGRQFQFYRLDRFSWRPPWSHRQTRRASGIHAFTRSMPCIEVFFAIFLGHKRTHSESEYQVLFQQALVVSRGRTRVRIRRVVSDGNFLATKQFYCGLGCRERDTGKNRTVQ